MKPTYNGVSQETAVQKIMGASMAVSSPTRSLRDESEGIHVHAIESLPQAIATDNIALREETVTMLAAMKDHRAVEQLIKTLHDESPTVRIKAFAALKHLGIPAVEALIETLQEHQSRITRACAAEALGKIGWLQAIEALTRALQDREPMVREHAAQALGHLFGGSVNEASLIRIRLSQMALQPLAYALMDKNTAVRMEVIETLKQIGNPKAVIALIRLLKDKKHAVREKAAKTILDLANPDALGPIIEALKDADEAVQLIGVRIVQMIKAKQSRHVTEAASRNKEVRIQTKPAEELNKAQDNQSKSSSSWMWMLAGIIFAPVFFIGIPMVLHACRNFSVFAQR